MDGHFIPQQAVKIHSAPSSPIFSPLERNRSEAQMEGEVENQSSPQNSFRPVVPVFLPLGPR